MAVEHVDPIMLDSTGQNIVTQLTRLANTQTYTAGDGIDINNANEISIKTATENQIGGMKIDNDTITINQHGVAKANIPTELNDLTEDVAISNPVNAQVLAYNSTSERWENQTGQAVVGGATFKGSILFANLPTSGMINGDWYDIKDSFTTDSRFEEGAGITCPAGTDVIWVADTSKWNILTASGVYSFNGRTGAVVPTSGDYTAEMVGAASIADLATKQDILTEGVNINISNENVITAIGTVAFDGDTLVIS